MMIIRDPLLDDHRIRLWIKRDDLLGEDDDQAYCGNKWRKLKYNIKKAKEEAHDTLLTYGGAFSNHIAATASAGRVHGFKTIGIIRGDRIEPLNPTLSFAGRCGMQLQFVSRSDYRIRSTPEFEQQLQRQFGRFFLLPEGGTNLHAIKGTEELGREIAAQLEEGPPDVVCVCCGTGGTMAGLIAGSDASTRVLGFPALKGDFLTEDIRQLLSLYGYFGSDNWRLIHDYHFGGYAKFDQALISFIRFFYEKKGIALDPIYTGKMMFGLWDLIGKGFFPEKTKIVAAHTGGLQGVAGFNQRFKQGLKV